MLGGVHQHRPIRPPVVPPVGHLIAGHPLDIDPGRFLDWSLPDRTCPRLIEGILRPLLALNAGATDLYAIEVHPRNIDEGPCAGEPR